MSGAARRGTIVDFPNAIARIREIPAISTDALISDGPVNPDRVLLDACADALADALRARAHVIGN